MMLIVLGLRMLLSAGSIVKNTSTKVKFVETKSHITKVIVSVAHNIIEYEIKNLKKLNEKRYGVTNIITK